jgi:uncharacterized membrane protein YkoI
LALLLAFALPAPWPVRHALADDDHERARAAVQRGEALPLRKILDLVDRDFRGRVLDVELDEEDDRLVYEIELLAPGGRKVELTYDAQTGDLVEDDDEDLDAVRRPREGR